MEETGAIRRKPPPDRRVAEIAERQHGVVTLAQLKDVGIGEHAVRHRVRAGRFFRVHRGVYAVGRLRVAGNSRWMAAVLAYSPDGLLSNRCAASLRALLLYSGRRIDVTSTRGKKRPGIVLHKVRQIPDHDKDMVENIPVTSVARTLIDIAPDVRPDQLERAVDNAERQGILDLRAFDGRAVPARCATC